MANTSSPHPVSEGVLAVLEQRRQTNLRFDAARQGEHAPYGLCFCDDRQKGTFVLRYRSDVPLLILVPFENLISGEKRMCCMGTEQNIDGEWVPRLQNIDD